MGKKRMWRLWSQENNSVQEEEEGKERRVETVTLQGILLFLESFPHEVAPADEVESQSSPDLTSAHEVESILPFEEKEMPPNETVFGSYIIPDSTTRFDQEEIQEHPSIKKIMNLAKAFIGFRLFGILLVFIDAGLIIMESILSRNELHIPVQYRMISLAIAIFFFIEILLQVYMDGKKYYFSDLLNIFDTVIIVITLCIDVTFIFFYSTILKNLPRVAVIFRPIRLVTLLRLFHLANQKRLLEQSARRMVSGNKRRYSKDGFDLDLTYVTARIIAMSFPSSGRRSFYRNPIEEVARFLDTKHFGHYFVYNLCREQSYNPMYFHDRVSRIKIDDHNVPSLREMILLARDAADWLAKDPQNVIAVHCKGGKGRTGTMICACLLANGMFSTAKESLYYFGVRRTDKSKSKKFQGVETPSQSRYVRYFETVKNVFHWSLPPEKTLKIKKIVIYSIHGVGRGDGTDITVEIIMQNKTMFTCTSQTCQLIHNMETNEAIFVIPNCPDLCDDVKVKFLSPNLPNYYDDCAFFLWFHTSFTEKNRLYLSREELDNPHKCKTWHIYRPDFGVELYFEQVDAK
ncbi:phosphatidylinositol 3,4,5-trisphosphate 3-phosphatase TPTE2-like [Thomomys bottae]